MLSAPWPGTGGAARRHAAVLGLGVRGRGWAQRLARAGWDVALFDPGAGPEVRRAVTGDGAAMPGRLTWHGTVSGAVAGAGLIVECAPERLALKRKLYQLVQAHCPPRAVVAAATPRFTPAQVQGCAPRPGQIVVVADAAPAGAADPRARLLVSARTPAPVALRAVAVLAALGLLASMPGASTFRPAPRAARADDLAGRAR